MSYNCVYVFIRRNTKPETGPRQSGSQRARTHGLAKERVNKPSTLQLQVRFWNFESVVSSLSQRESEHAAHSTRASTARRLMPCSR